MTMYGFHKLTSTLKSMEGINSDERYFEGLLTVQMKDKQGEVTIVDELYKVLPIWIDRGAPISDTHSNRIVGKGINYSRTTVKSDDGEILPAIKITGKIFKNYELDNVIWDKIKNNEYKGLSFGGATRSARQPLKMKDGSTAYALGDLEHYEVAVCKDPAVPMAIITDFNHIAKATFDSTVRDDGKMVIQCDKMSCYVEKADLLTTMESEKPENQEKVLEGQSRGQPIDKPAKANPNVVPESYPVIARDFVDDQEDKESKNFKDKMMEKKEMLEAVIGNPNEKKPTQEHSGEREEVTSGYKTAAGYKTDTEDRNSGTGINDVIREKPEEKLPIKGSLSQELPNQIQQADLNESQTFEQKVQALIAEGKSRESAEKIVGSFVHKVEASSGSGGAGIGDATNSNGGTITTQTGGANNPVHNNGCDCDCKDCTRDYKCDCCEKCKNKSRGLDISNTNAGGVMESAYNQDAPNAQRLNNKADEKLTEEGKKMHDSVKEYVKQKDSYDMYKSNAAVRINKLHGVMKVNTIHAKLKRNEFQETSTQARINPSGNDKKHLKDVKPYLPNERHALREASTIDHRVGNTAPLERKDPPNKMGGKTGHAGSMPPQTGKRGSPKVDPRMRKKDPIKTLPMQIKQALAELKKLHTSGGLGSRGLGAGATYTQGQTESTQITRVQPREEDDRVSSKRTTKEPKE